MTDRIGPTINFQPIQQPAFRPANAPQPQMPGQAAASPGLAGDLNGAVGQVAAIPGGDIPLPPGAEDDRTYVTQLYKDLLGRAPDEEGMHNHLMGLANGTTREQLREVFLNSQEYKDKKALVDGKPLGDLPTIPMDPSYLNAPIDTSSLEKAVESAAAWARKTSPELEAKLMKQPPPDKVHERQIYYQLATKVIGALRAHGIDADRLVRASHNEPGNANRYVSDALVLPDGRAIDFFGNDDGLTPQFHDLEVNSPKTDRNTGITDPSKPLSSSTLG